MCVQNVKHSACKSPLEQPDRFHGLLIGRIVILPNRFGSAVYVADEK